MRTIDQIMGDGLWPSYGSPAEGIRHTAIFKVLSEMLPEYVYQHLVQKAKNFRWFIPKGGQHFGQLQQFPATGKDPDGKSEAVVIYLSPELDPLPLHDYDDVLDLAIATVLHELAHFVLGHREENVDENQAWNLVVEWGFKDLIEKRT